jgi:tRNA threonylcarbamoyl adenosine modification protein YeaZ
MILLAIDTAANLCAACVYDTAREEERARSVLDIGTGHAEHLMAVIGEALKTAELGYADIGAVAVSVGPGSFTGVRVGVAAARGLALALKIPSIGVTTLEGLAVEARRAFPGSEVLAAIDARRDEVYAALYARDGSLLEGPLVAKTARLGELARDLHPVLAGSAAAMVAQADGLHGEWKIGPTGATADIGVYASIAASKRLTGEKPRPLYLRGADAKPQAGFALPRKAS